MSDFVFIKGDGSNVKTHQHYINISLYSSNSYIQDNFSLFIELHEAERTLPRTKVCKQNQYTGTPPTQI